MPLSLPDLPMNATPKQAAEVLGLTESQVRGLMRDRKLGYLPVGCRLMVPRDAIARFMVDNIVEPICQGETKVPGFTGTGIARVGTSPGLSEAAAGSAARALQIAASLKSPSPSSSISEAGTRGHVIPLRSS
jgi:hypothetical protein